MEWISVNDRLPVYGEKVLVFTEYNSYYIAVLGKYDTFETYSGGYELTSIVYWMPLPEPPKD